MNSSSTIKYTQFLILKQRKRKSPGPDGFTEEFYQMSVEKLTPFIYNVLQKNAIEQNQPFSSNSPKLLAQRKRGEAPTICSLDL